MNKEEFKRRYNIARSAGGAAADGNIWARSQAGDLPESIFPSIVLGWYFEGQFPALELRGARDEPPAPNPRWYYQRGTRGYRVAGPKGRLP